MGSNEVGEERQDATRENQVSVERYKLAPAKLNFN
jgi:hypothetical protein